MLGHRERLAKERERAAKAAMEAIVLLTSNQPGYSCTLGEIREITKDSTDSILITNYGVTTSIRKTIKALVCEKQIEVKRGGPDGRTYVITLLKPITRLHTN